MDIMQSFLLVFYILDQCYFQCGESDLGGFLGTISPELWTDGQAVDKSVYQEWQQKNSRHDVTPKNIIKFIVEFLEYNERKYNFNFSQTKILLNSDFSKKMVEKALNNLKKHNT